jgi:hypothetical protein
MKILESYSAIAKSLLLEDDDDRYVHIGYGKYKEKDSRTGEPLPNSPVYIKTDAGKYIMPDDDEKGGEEKPKGGGMGSDDFERDFDKGDEKSSYFDDPADLSPSQKAHTAAADAELDRIDKDDEPKVPAPDSKSDTGKPRVSANPYDDNYGQEVDAKEFEEDGAVDVALSDESLVRGEREPETPAEVAAMAIVKDAIENDIITSEPNSTDIFYNIQDKIRNGEYERQDAVDSLKGGKDESITINGKQYRPIKESKQHILKENYERFFGDKK